MTFGSRKEDLQMGDGSQERCVLVAEGGCVGGRRMALTCIAVLFAATLSAINLLHLYLHALNSQMNGSTAGEALRHYFRVHRLASIG